MLREGFQGLHKTISENQEELLALYPVLTAVNFSLYKSAVYQAEW